jgi:hypothetical protein
MRKNKLVRRGGRIVAALGGIIAAAAAIAGAEPIDVSGMPQSRFALVLIDVDGLACGPCLASLQEFCRAVPPAIQEERVIGVLTYRTGNKADPKLGRIARTKWAGYSRANGIRFPAAVDESQSFNRLSEAGTTILLFDPRTGEMKRRTAPFTPGAIAGAQVAPDCRSPAEPHCPVRGQP